MVCVDTIYIYDALSKSQDIFLYYDYNYYSK